MSHKHRPPREPQGNYEVGYRKPPRNTQFRPGTSGNPKGRPKRKMDVNFQEDFRAMLWRVNHRPITSKINGKKQTMTFLEAMYMKLMSRALEGHGPSMRLVDRNSKDTLADYEEQRLGLYAAARGLMDSIEANGEKPSPREKSLIDEVLKRVNTSVSGEDFD